MYAIESPLALYTDTRTGLPLEGGNLYFGTVNQNPETTPTTVYWDAAGTQPAAQPVRTLAGLPVRAGTPATLYVPGDYSLTVRDSFGRLLYTQGTSATWSIASIIAAAIATFTAFVASLASNIGASLVGFIVAGSSFLRTLLAWINDYPNVKNFGAKGDGTTDDSAAIQTALDYLFTNGGDTLFFPRGTYRHDTPLRVQDNVNLLGAGRRATTLYKNTTTPLSVTIVAGAQTVYNNATLPSNMNASVILDGPGGHYHGSIKKLRILGGLGTAGQPETAKVEFLLVSVGSVSDFVLDDVQLESGQYSGLFPTGFDWSMSNVRVESCLRGIAINSGTSLTYETVYANNCRDWGHYWNDLKYSTFTGNACDFVNSLSLYPTRTRTCAAYRMSNLYGCTVANNGDENSCGWSLQLDVFDRSTLTGHTSISLGSDYVGAGQMGWMSIATSMRGSSVFGNSGYDVKGSGLLSGGAVSGQHHNIYVDPATIVVADRFDGNLVAANRASTVEAGWGNNVPTNWPNAAALNGLAYSYLAGTYAPTISAQNANDVTYTRSTEDRHFVQEKGVRRQIDSCFHGPLTWTTANGFFQVGPFPQNGSKTAFLDVWADPGFGTLAARPMKATISPGQSVAIVYDTTGAAFSMAKLTSGNTYKIFVSGEYSAV